MYARRVTLHVPIRTHGSIPFCDLLIFLLFRPTFPNLPIFDFSPYISLGTFSIVIRHQIRSKHVYNYCRSIAKKSIVIMAHFCLKRGVVLDVNVMY